MSTPTVDNKTGISAKIVADSITERGDRITTFELEYPRFIHSELMTHRVFSRNAASSRAIPIKKKIKMVWDNPAVPAHWGKNQAGMQAKAELSGWKLKAAQFIWKASAKVACGFATLLDKIGLHKQLANRLLEPWERYKVIVTATSFDNWFWLRNHPDAQPEIQVLAKMMLQSYNRSNPFLIKEGEWHLPYVETTRKDGVIEYRTTDSVTGRYEIVLSLEEAIKVSASCCAQVSFRLNDTSYEKANTIYDRLVNSTPVHASPFEHQATPVEIPTWQLCNGLWRNIPGVTHVNKDLKPCSGNFIGWIQNRQLIPNNVQNDYEGITPIIL